MRSLILASTSRYRRQLLERLGIPFTTANPGVDETPVAGEPASKLAVRLAVAKARTVQANDSVVIGSDQTAALDGELLGKPGTRENTVRQLSRLSGRAVTFHSGICVRDSADGREFSETVAVDVLFRDLSDAEIAAYVDAENPFDCAGGFKSEGLGVALFERIDSSDPSALIGLPLIRLCALLRKCGIDPLRKL